MSICKQITLTAKENSVAALKTLLITMVEPSRQEQGCLRYDLFQYQDNPEQFFIVEEWQDETDLERHKQAIHFKNFKSEAPALLAKKASLNLLGLA